MKTDKATNSNNLSSQQQAKSKEARDQKTSLQFTVSIIIGVLVIIVLAAVGYYITVGF